MKRADCKNPAQGQAEKEK
jgi:hypothetical protein